MNARLLGLAMVVGLSLPVAAQAQMLAPGLWELTTSNMKVDNQDLPDLSLILGQLKQQMTPEQRAMLEKQGVTMAGKGVQVCLTPAQVGLKINIKPYEPLSLGGATYLFAASIAEIQANPALKRPLWEGMKSMFKI